MAGRVAITAMIGVNSSAMSRGLKRAGTKMRGWAKASMARLAAITKAGMLLAGAAFAIFAVKGVKAFAQLEKGMNEVFTLLPGISKSAMGKMEEQVLQLSQKMGVIPEEVVPALYQALSAGIPAGNVFNFLETAVKTAKAGVSDTETAVRTLSSVVNTYGAENISATQVADILFQTVKSGVTTFSELAGSLYNVLPVAKAAGISFQDIAAAVAAMTKKGTPTAQAMTQLKAAILSIMAPTKRTAGLFQNYGLNVRELGETMKGPGGLVSAMNQIVDATNGDAQALRRLLGSTEALNAVLTLTGDRGVEFTNILTGMASESGQMEAAFTQMDKGLSRSWEKISANAKVAMIKFGKALAPLIHKVTPAIQRVIGIIGGIDWARIINGFARVWVVGIKPLFDNLVRVLSNLPWGNLLMTLRPVAEVIIKTIRKLIMIATALAPAIVPGIGVLGALFLWIYKGFFLMVALVHRLAPSLGKIFKTVFEIMRTAFLFFMYPTQENFKAFVTFTKTKLKELWKHIKELGVDLKKIAQDVFKEIKKIVVPIMIGLFRELVLAGEKWLKQFPGFTDAAEGLRDTWQNVKTSLTEAWETLKKVFGRFSKQMEEAKESSGPLKEIFGELGESLVKLFIELMHLVGGLGTFLGILAECYAMLFNFSTSGASGAKKMSGFTSVIWVLITPIRLLVDLLGMIVNGWAKIFEQLNKLKPVMKAIAMLIGLLFKGLKFLWGKILDFAKDLHKAFTNMLGAIAELFVTAFYAIVKTVKDSWEKLKEVFNLLKDLVFHILFGGTITKDFKKAFDYIKGVVMEVLDKIQDVFKTVFDGVKMGLDGLLKVFKSFGDFVNKIFDKILSVGGKAMDLAKGVLKAAGGVFGGILGKLGVGGGGGGGGGKAKPVSGPDELSTRNKVAILTTSLKPIVEKLTSMDGSLKSIDTTLKGKFVNQ